MTATTTRRSAPSKRAVVDAAPATSKRAPRAKSFAQRTALSRTEAALMERMSALEPNDPLYRVLESALAFKASWVILGEHLHDVMAGQQYKQWGYASFSRFCTDEIRVSTATARKLVRSFEWLGEEAPDLIPRFENGRITPSRPVPDYQTVGVLADARRELARERVPEDAYVALKQAALDGEKSAGELRRELKAAIPERLRMTEVDPVRALRRALTASVKAIEGLREWDGNDELLVRAEQLRDAIAHHMPRGADGREAEPTSGSE